MLKTISEKDLWDAIQYGYDHADSDDEDSLDWYVKVAEITWQYLPVDSEKKDKC